MMKKNGAKVSPYSTPSVVTSKALLVFPLILIILLLLLLYRIIIADVILGGIP